MRGHTTHFDDCGCLTARYEARIAELEQREREFDKLHAVQVARVEILIGEKATLEAELSGVRQASATELAHAYAHAKTLRDALAIIHDGHGGGAAFIAGEALAATPAASLAAYRKGVIEEAVWAAQEHVNRLAGIGPKLTGRGLSALAEAERIVESLRALAAQAATPTVTLLGTPVAVSLHDPDVPLEEGQWVENGIVYRRQEVKP